MAIYLFSQILKYKLSIKLIEKLSRRHLIKSSDVFFIQGSTVSFPVLSFLVLSFPVLSFPDLSFPVLSFYSLIISWLILSLFYQDWNSQWNLKRILNVLNSSCPPSLNCLKFRLGNYENVLNLVLKLKNDKVDIFRENLVSSHKLVWNNMSFQSQASME